MKKVILTVVAIAAFVLSAAAADNVANKSLTVQSKARIITPITLANTGSQALDFGVIARGLASSTVVVGSVATPPVSVGGDAIVLSSAPQTAAKFTVTGETAKTYAITIPSSAQTITDGASNNLSITAFSCSNGAIGTIGTGDVFYVGGTLTVPSTAVAASYTGTFNVTVAYN